MVPALAVADALRARGAEPVFFGGERAEAELVPEAGYELRTLPLSGIDRRNPLKAARACGRAGRAVALARRHLREIDADAFVGGGGYAAGPVGLAAATLRVPIALCEADSHLGLANRLLAPLAGRVFLAFPIDGRDGGKYRVVGRAVPGGAGLADRGDARARLGVPPDRMCVLVFGGSLGARSINEAAVEAFGADTRGLAVLHACGRRDAEWLSRRLEQLGSAPGYLLRPWIHPFADALAAADLVVARAGGSVLELAAAGLPAILVPYPHATADHQTGNARWMAEGGAAVVVPDGELTPARLAVEVGLLLGDPSRLQAMAHASAALARPHAARDIARVVLAAAS